jgi:hypothetical protein
MMATTARLTWSVKPTPVPETPFLRQILGTALLLALLAGCQTTGEGTATGGTSTDSTGTVSGVGEAAKPDGKVAAAQAIRFNASEFKGFSPDRVLPILGAPDFVRRDGNAQIWQYRATNCVLDLFLYKTGGETTVKHAELRPRIPGAETLDACYSRMRQERKTQPSG